MEIFLTVVLFIVIFSLLIFIHELGHFTAAKRAGVKVEEFGFGLPPRMFGVKKGETIYSINWIPFGGFVRLLGEDTSTKESRESKRSFINQPLRTQAWIVVAGVVMNLLLSFVLLTIGFWIGIEPLISTEEDFYEGIREGTVNVEPGIVVVETMDYGVPEADELQKIPVFEAGDRILSVETLEEWVTLTESVTTSGETATLTVQNSSGDVRELTLTQEALAETTFAPMYLPRLIYKAEENSAWGDSLQNGDALIEVNGEAVLTDQDLYAALEKDLSGSLQVYRPSVGELTVDFSLNSSNPLVTYLQPDAPAILGGLQMGDEILALNGTEVQNSEEITALTPELAEQGPITYTVRRGEETLTFTLTPREADGRVGIGLSDMLPNYGNLSLYQGYVPHTLMGFDMVQYGWSAPVVAIKEMGRLAKITAVMFGGVLQQFVTGAGVPEGVAGPVGIAQMTFVTVQNGFAALLRFVALLSLSLGVINILPIPALDGGKFFFIAIRAITGKAMNPKYEGLIHAAGFFFLIALIVYITFNDVMNLF